MQMVAERRETPMGHYDEKFKRVDERFEEVNHRITEGKEDTDRRLGEVKDEVREVKGEVGALREGMETLHGGIHQATLALWIGSAGIAATILFKG